MCIRDRTYLYARRWGGAIQHYETHIENRAPVGMVSPQLMVELVRAYTEEENLEGAAKTMESIEKLEIFGRPVLQPLKARARLFFLAATGKTPHVKTLVGEKGPLHDMPKASKTFWTGIAEMKSGDRQAARRSIQRAVELAKNDKRAKDFALAKLARLEEDDVSGPKVLDSYVASMSKTLSEKVSSDLKNEKKQNRVVKSMGKTKWSEVPVTLVMIGINIAVAMVMWLKYSSLGDVGGIIAMGANVRSATMTGEWWRLLTSLFVHVGLAHLILNVYGLWILGRLSEKMFSHWRYIIIYLVSGVCGALASTASAKGAISAGASGAVLGVLGGLAAELFLRRNVYAAWGRVVLGNLLFLILANVVIGFLYPVIDQSAHIGGMVSGLCLGALFALQRQPSKWLNRLVAGIALCVVASFFLATVFLYLNPHGNTLKTIGLKHIELNGRNVEIPVGWVEDVPGQWVDSVNQGGFDMSLLEKGQSIDSWIEKRILAEKGNIKEKNAINILDDESGFLDAWRSQSLQLILDGMGGTTSIRLVILGKETKAGAVVGALYYPEALWTEVRPFYSDILGAFEEH